MNDFTSTLIVSPLPDGKTWVIRSAFGFNSKPGEHVNVPVGFETDFASVPRILWLFFSPWDVYGNAAVIHDWLYWNQELTREESDNIFLQGMIELEVVLYKRFCLYHAVRLFGWWAWWINKQLKDAGDIRIRSDLLPVSDKGKQRLEKPIWRNKKLYRATIHKADKTRKHLIS